MRSGSPLPKGRAAIYIYFQHYVLFVGDASGTEVSVKGSVLEFPKL